MACEEKEDAGKEVGSRAGRHEAAADPGDAGTGQEHGVRLQGRRDNRTDLGDESSNGEIFYSLKEAQVAIENWRVHDNTRRPRPSFGYSPPAPLTIAPPKPPFDAMANMH